jgi:hypothetical protein
MAKLKGTIVLSKNGTEHDLLMLEGDSSSMALLLSLVNPDAVLKPRIDSPKKLAQILKGKVKMVVLKIGDDSIPKDVLIAALGFCEVKK